MSHEQEQVEAEGEELPRTCTRNDNSKSLLPSLNVNEDDDLDTSCKDGLIRVVAAEFIHPTVASLQRPKRSGRHGARNQHRHKSFAKWLLERFPHVLLSQNNGRLHHVLDVAGGKGELAARLSMCHKVPVVLVDPRLANVAQCFQQVVLPKLPKKHQERIQQRLEEDPGFVEDIIQSRVRQMVIPFDKHTLVTSVELQEAIRNATLLVGMHADSATEAIVDAALSFHKPFVVVPCCVFPSLFSQRTLLQQDGSRVQVRSHDQFCQYLARKDSRFVLETLPIEGRNTAIWWDGRGSGRQEDDSTIDGKNGSA